MSRMCSRDFGAMAVTLTCSRVDTHLVILEGLDIDPSLARREPEGSRGWHPVSVKEGPSGPGRRLVSQTCHACGVEWESVPAPVHLRDGGQSARSFRLATRRDGSMSRPSWMTRWVSTRLHA